MTALRGPSCVFLYQDSRAFVESQGLPSNLACFLEAESGKLDIKRRKPGTLFISLEVGSLFKLAIMT